MSDTGHCYETKCRRCGKIASWYSGIESWDDFYKYCCQESKNPILCKCEVCKRKTFQDIVSFFIT